MLAGADKASALGLALAGASIDEVPAAGAEGRKRTVFFVDQDAAAEVPDDLIAPIVLARTSAQHEAPERRCGRLASTLRGQLAATRAQLLERLVEKRLGLFFGAALLHVGEVRLVRLELGERGRVLLVAPGGQPAVAGSRCCLGDLLVG